MSSSEIGSHLRKIMNDRSRLNIISLDALHGAIPVDEDGTYDIKCSPCVCHRRLVLHPDRKNTLMCPGCGTQIKIMSQKEIDTQLKKEMTRKNGGGKQSFLISQKQSEKKNEYLEEDQRIAGGIITESDESWYYPS